ncbi:MAG TPA: aminotransferase class V-fold PLP-dependent enzyme [Candidatus Peribacteraceae bacterium]|nr:aminotransferase class V-fold PLP-dependent enzyme [Candidatus Peribacteraceae bacterium]
MPKAMFKQKSAPAKGSTSGGDFGYLPPEICYFDSACQTLRPQPVIDAQDDYYLHYNACGGRVKYHWGAQVDAKVREARQLLLEFAGKRAPEYVVAFTLNTTYGINLVLHQLPVGVFKRIVTTDIEHNSVMLPSITWAKRNGTERKVLSREDDGTITYASGDLDKSVVLINSVSNIDGRSPSNLKQLAADAHAAGGILLVDAAQGFTHDVKPLRETDFDAAFGSGHKMYGPSVGFIIIKRSLLKRLEPFFIGGGMVTDAREDTFDLLREGEEAHAILEPGLQNWAGIIGLGAAIQWLNKQPAEKHERALAEALFAGLQKMPRVQMLNHRPSPIVSLSVDGIDAHRLALYLDEQNIMCRSGHFCCHAYLQHKRELPPQLRVSLGLYNTTEQIQHFLKTLDHIFRTL